jgi:tetratricopeptide (TPR) repeat protein
MSETHANKRIATTLVKYRLFPSFSVNATAECSAANARQLRKGRLVPSTPTWPRASTAWRSFIVIKGQYGKADPLYGRALAIREKALGPEHPDVAVSLNNMASLYYVQGQYAKAGLLYQRALAIYEKTLGSDHPNVATCQENYAFYEPWVVWRKQRVLRLEPMRFGLGALD